MKRILIHGEIIPEKIILQSITHLMGTNGDSIFGFPFYTVIFPCACVYEANYVKFQFGHQHYWLLQFNQSSNLFQGWPNWFVIESAWNCFSTASHLNGEGIIVWKGSIIILCCLQKHIAVCLFSLFKIRIIKNDLQFPIGIKWTGKRLNNFRKYIQMANVRNLNKFEIKLKSNELIKVAENGNDKRFHSQWEYCEA